MQQIDLWNKHGQELKQPVSKGAVLSMHHFLENQS